jgi:AbrB family looped-hinge helix DNA binding protein
MIDMVTVTLSPKFQLVVPQAVRERMQLRPGEKLQVLSLEGRIELIPLRPMRELRGAYPGLDTHIERDADRLGPA